VELPVVVLVPELVVFVLVHVHVQALSFLQEVKNSPQAKASIPKIFDVVKLCGFMFVFLILKKNKPNILNKHRNRIF
jgi:hypothetical protein